MAKNPEQATDLNALIEGFRASGYVLDRALATSIYLLIKLGKPLLIEGHAETGSRRQRKRSLRGMEFRRRSRLARSVGSERHPEPGSEHHERLAQPMRYYRRFHVAL